MSEFEKIAILLHEYDTLRNEILERHASLVAFYVILTLMVSYAITLLWRDRANISGRILLVLVVAIFAIVTLVFNADTVRAAKRIRQIETEVNARAGEVLLRWETEWGAGKRIGRFFPRSASER